MNSIFKIHAETINDYYPSLFFNENIGGKSFIEGSLNLSGPDGVILDTYKIRIEEGDNYPHSFPYVYETGGRLPVNIDWHMFDDGHCCIKSPPEESLICKSGINLKLFITQQLIPYFFNQKHRELHGYYLNERSHGILGILEYFYDLFKSKDLKRIAKVLYRIKINAEPNRTEICFCGSKLKFRKCCRAPYRILSNFNIEEIDKYLQIILLSSNFKQS